MSDNISVVSIISDTSPNMSSLSPQQVTAKQFPRLVTALLFKYYNYSLACNTNMGMWDAMPKQNQVFSYPVACYTKTVIWCIIPKRPCSLIYQIEHLANHTKTDILTVIRRRTCCQLCAPDGLVVLPERMSVSDTTLQRVVLCYNKTNNNSD